MAERQRGLGQSGLNRIRGNIGGSIGGNEITAYERQMFGTARAVPPQPTTAWEYPDSTRVKAYQYDFEQKQLRVRFIKYATPWVYHGVIEPVFAAFDAAESKGRYINSTLNYTEHRRATAAEESQYFNDGYGE